MSVIHVSGFDVHLSHKTVKNINLRIDSQGRILVSAPMKCPLILIQQFLEKKQDWIRSHQIKIRHALLSSALSLKSEEEHFFLGRAYPLKIYEHASQHRVVIEENHLCCYVKSAANTDVKHLLTHWQKQQMQLLLPALIQKWEAIIGVQVSQWAIRSMKTRWGSCNPLKKRICLNLCLIQYPLICLEYVVVHELVHLLEASHNQRFYALMSRFLPHWREYKSLLNKSWDIDPGFTEVS